MTKRISPAVSQYMAKIGAKGGASGKGKSKVRGNSAKYRELALARWRLAKKT
jgi:hypothetical protein